MSYSVQYRDIRHGDDKVSEAVSLFYPQSLVSPQLKEISRFKMFSLHILILLLLTPGKVFSSNHRCFKHSDSRYEYSSCYFRSNKDGNNGNYGTICDLEANKLSKVPRDIPNHPNLHLNVNYNNIRMVKPGMLSHLNKTVQICFVNNKIKQIQANSFCGLSKLLTLSFEKNKLSEIHHGLWDGLDSLQELNLAENRIHYIGTYCDVPGSPFLSKKWVKCTVHFFKKNFISSYP